MSTLEDTVATLAARMTELEDRLSIYQLMSAYGPAVDGGASDAAAALWTEEGVYDPGMGEAGVFHRAAEVAAMVEGDMHRGIIAGGSAHLIGMPHVELNGDHAVATGYSQLLRYDAEGAVFKVWRATANRWEMARTPDGWKVTSRVNRLLDGSEEARALLRAGVAPSGESGGKR